MEFVAGGSARRIALLPGAWNPPTRAHIAMARAALQWADRAVMVAPRRLPHKEFGGAPFQLRVDWLRRLAEPEAGIAAAMTEGGLFVEMAREARALGAEQVYLVCGRDAAERIVSWDYGPGESIAQQLEEYELLVAERLGRYCPPPALAARIHLLALDGDWEHVSSSEVRERIRQGREWRELVPGSIAESVAAAYGAGNR